MPNVLIRPSGGSRLCDGRRTQKVRKPPIARYQESPHPSSTGLAQAPLICKSAIEDMEEELRQGESMAALRRFNDVLRAMPAAGWRERLTPVFAEFTFNLESFNPAFAAVLLAVQSTIGASDYIRRDRALKRLIVPLAGEYGMHNGELQSKTHRELFDDWVRSILGTSAPELISSGTPPSLGRALFACMMRDLRPVGDATHGGTGAMEHACYALGYNLAIEFLADYEKRWMLESFRGLQDRFLATAGVEPDWVFLEVHAEDEKEHAAIGHEAVCSFVPAECEHLLQQGMFDHDRDFAVFYNGLADLLET